MPYAGAMRNRYVRYVDPKVSPVKGSGGEHGLPAPPPMPSRWVPSRPEHPAPLSYRVAGAILLVAIIWMLIALA